MAPQKDYYQILQISHHADPAIVKAAYYAHLHVLKKHPDLGGSEEEAKVLNEAYEILSDEQKRKEYDKKLLSNVIPLFSSVAKKENPFTPSKEQRIAVRVAFQQAFQFRQYPKGIWFDSQFRDISAKGACFRSIGKFREGDLVEFEMSKEPHVWAVAKVKWARLLPQRFGSPLHEGGVEFQQIDVSAFQEYLQSMNLSNLSS